MKNRSTKTLAALVAVLLLGATLLGCAAPAASTAPAAPAAAGEAAAEPAGAPSGEPIKIGSLNHVTGVGASWGVPMQMAIELAVEELNASGGVLGRPVELIAEDDNTDTDMALQKAKKLALEDKVEAIFGGVWSSIRAAVVTNVADPYKVPYFYPTYNEGGGTLANCSRYYICTGMVPNQQVAEFVPYLIENYGKKIYLVGIDEVFITDSWKYIEENQLVEKAGGEIVGKDLTSWEVGDWSACLQRIQESGADIVYPYIGGSEMINFVKQFYDFGMNENMTLASVYLDETFVPSFPEDLRDGILCSASYFQSIDTPENQKFVKAFQDKYGTEYGISNCVEGAYTSVMLWAAAVEKAGVVDKEAMLDALPEVTVNAPSGEVRISPVNNHAVLHSYIGKCNKDGTFEVLVDLGMIEPKTACDFTK